MLSSTKVWFFWGCCPSLEDP